MTQKQINSKVVGIDLGTTNSAISVFDPADKKILTYTDHETGSDTTPSVVYKDPITGEILVGDKAVNRIGTIPEPVRSIKRQMGRDMKVMLTDTQVSPEEVSAYILSDMKRKGEIIFSEMSNEQLLWRINQAVITIPAYFNANQIEATFRAGKLAGLDVLELLHEPTAACIYYTWKNGISDGVFLVYDLGGGTFDVSIIRCVSGLFEVVAISGNNLLGGDDIDTEIARYILGRLKEVKDCSGATYNLDLNPGQQADRLIFSQMLRLAEQVKIGLSNSSYYRLEDASIKDKDGKSLLISIEFSREEIERIMLPLIQRTMNYCYDAIHIAEEKRNIQISDIDEIILVGGSTHIPLVREVVRSHLCMPGGIPCTSYPVKLSDPRTEQGRIKATMPVYMAEVVQSIVAFGAAIQAAARGGIVVSSPEAPDIRIELRGLGSSGEPRTYVAGVVRTEKYDLKGWEIVLHVEELQYSDRQQLSADGSFFFSKVPLTETTTTLSFTLLDEQNDIIGRYSRVMYRDKQADYIDPTHSPVLSKPILIEVLQNGIPGRKELFPSLTPLPIEEKYTFFYPGLVDRIRIPIYQKQSKIHEIQVPVPPDVTRGKSIELNVRIDEHYLISVKGKIESTNVEFAADIRPPSEHMMPTKGQIEILTELFHHKILQLMKSPSKNGSCAVYTSHYDQLMSSLQSAMEHNDVDRAIDDYYELEELIDSIQIVILIPPLDEFEDFANQIESYNQSVSGTAQMKGIVHDADMYSRLIHHHKTQGRHAFETENQGQYSKSYDALQKIEESLHDVASSGQNYRRASQSDLAWAHYFSASSSVTELLGTGENIQNFKFRDELLEIQNELSSIEDEISQDPAKVLSRLKKMDQRLKQIKNSLANQKVIDGLIEDRVSLGGEV